MNSFEGAVRERFLLVKRKKRMPTIAKSTTTPTTTPTMMGVLGFLELSVFLAASVGIGFPAPSDESVELGKGSSVLNTCKASETLNIGSYTWVIQRVVSLKSGG